MSVRTEHDAAALLAQAVRLLQPRREPVRLIVLWHDVEYAVRFDWSGVVHVLPLRSNEPLVSSVAGDPSMIATWREES
jgi:hypothetical protein